MCCCRRPPNIFDHIEYLRTKKNEDVQNKVLSIIKEADIEETARSHEYLLTDYHNKEAKDKSVLFTTKNQDNKNYWISGRPKAIAGTNIHSMIGGRVNLWENSSDRIGIKNPYSESGSNKFKGNFSGQKYDDDILEFNSMYSIIDIGLGIGYRLAQDRGPFELKFKDSVNKFILNVSRPNNSILICILMASSSSYLTQT